MSGSSSFRKFATSSSSAFFVRILAAGSAFGMSVVVTRTLGPHQAGLFFLGQTLLLVLGILARFGMDQVLIRFVSTSIDQKNFAAANGVLWKATSVALPLSMAIAGTTYAFSDLIATGLMNQPELSPIVRTVALCIIPYSCFQLLSYAIQGRKQFIWSMLINAALLPMVILAFAAFPGVLGIYSADDLMSVVLWACVAIAILSILIWFRGVGVRSDGDSVDYKSIIEMAGPIYVLAIASFANMWLPQFVLAALASADQIAILNVSQRSASLVSLLSVPICTVASPTFAIMYAKRQTEEIQKFVARVNGIICLICLPALALLFIFAADFLTIFGDSFADAKWVLRILVIGQLFNTVSGTAGHLLMMSANERAVRNAMLVSLVLGLVLSLSLIPSFGAIGAAAAVAGSMMLTNALIWVIVHEQLGINVFRPSLSFATNYLRTRQQSS